MATADRDPIKSMDSIINDEEKKTTTDQEEDVMQTPSIEKDLSENLDVIATNFSSMKKYYRKMMNEKDKVSTRIENLRDLVYREQFKIDNMKDELNEVLKILKHSSDDVDHLLHIVNELKDKLIFDIYPYD